MTKDERRVLYDSVFKTINGEKVIKDMAKLCKMDYTSFSADPLQMAYREGQKEFYRRITNILEAN